MFLGHLFPVFHRFKGGKGVATTAGIVFALHWPLGLALLVVWAIMAFGFKISSLAALTAAVLLPLGAFYVFGNFADRVGDGADRAAAVLAASRATSSSSSPARNARSASEGAPTLASLAAPEGAGQFLGSALRN